MAGPLFRATFTEPTGPVNPVEPDTFLIYDDGSGVLTLYKPDLDGSQYRRFVSPTDIPADVPQPQRDLLAALTVGGVGFANGQITVNGQPIGSATPTTPTLTLTTSPTLGVIRGGMAPPDVPYTAGEATRDPSGAVAVSVAFRFGLTATPDKATWDSGADWITSFADQSDHVLVRFTYSAEGVEPLVVYLATTVLSALAPEPALDLQADNTYAIEGVDPSTEPFDLEMPPVYPGPYLINPAVLEIGPLLLGGPSIEATSTSVGGVMSANPDALVVSLDRQVACTRQWLRNGTEIAGATDPTYAIVAADQGTQVTLRETATDIHGTRSATSEPLAIPAAALAPSNTTAPAITGTAQVGQTLTVSDGTWSSASPITYSRAWKRDGVAISGATGSTYLLVVTDQGAVITCTVTATNDAGSASATSAGTVAVAAAEGLQVTRLFDLATGTRGQGGAPTTWTVPVDLSMAAAGDRVLLVYGVNSNPGDILLSLEVDGQTGTMQAEGGSTGNKITWSEITLAQAGTASSFVRATNSNLSEAHRIDAYLIKGGSVGGRIQSFFSYGGLTGSLTATPTQARNEVIVSLMGHKEVTTAAWTGVSLVENTNNVAESVGGSVAAASDVAVAPLTIDATVTSTRTDTRWAMTAFVIQEIA